MHARRRLLLSSLLALTALPVRGAVPVRYPHFELQDHGAGVPHQVRLLELALAGKPYSVQASQLVMRQSRALLELAAGRNIDVLWTVTSRQREQSLLPIRIPLDMGLIGWRLLLIRKADAARFAAIRSVEQLKALRAVQGHDWPDTEIMQANGFRVETASDFSAMFRMLGAGRVDYFPRAVFEAEYEAEAYADQQLMVAPGLCLYYPSALYFFVHPHHTALASALQQGLEQALLNGSFQRIFTQSFGNVLQRAALDTRQIHTLNNPLLPESTPLAQRMLWYRPDSRSP
jgi:ABC-type amino acid transport substrate-binding protein